MRIGLFECDHVAEKYQYIDGDYRDMFAALFPGLEIRNYDVYSGHFPKDLSECDAYMCTGSLHSVYEDIGWIKHLQEKVREIYLRNIPFIGICFGHQLIAESLGGKVMKNKDGWCVGVHTFELLVKEDWMQPFQKEINIIMLCQDQVYQLPDNSIILARSQECPTAMYRVGENILGIQGHPEFSTTYNRVLMEARIARIGKQKVNNGIASLKKPIHTELVRSWILNFLKG